MIRLLIADNSALMRKVLEDIFLQEGDFDIRLARNGNEALELVRSFDPQVVTLDIQMPGMDGLTCLSQIMIEAPRPVVMISSLTAEGAEATLEAIELGAVDFVAKPSGTVSLEIDRLRPVLVEKVRAAANARIRRTLRLTERVRHQIRGAGLAARAPTGPYATEGTCQARPQCAKGQEWCTAGTGADRHLDRRPGRARRRVAAAAGGLPVAGIGSPAFASELHRRICQTTGPRMPASRRRSGPANALEARDDLHRQRAMPT